MPSKKHKNMSVYEREYLKLLAKENLIKHNLEKSYMRNHNAAIYIPFEDAKINWVWNPKEVGWFDALWDDGVSIQDISTRLRRPLLEVVILLMDRNYRGKIKSRDGGIWGLK